VTAAPAIPEHDRRGAIKFIICLGAVSLFADMTYEGAYSILGPYLKELGATAGEVGLIAGLGEMIAASLRYFTGRLADRTKAYWTIALLGYGLNLLVVPLLAIAGTWQAAAVLVVVERTGKALRGPARDVLLSAQTHKVGHGWGFGLHAAMDQTGAVLGPLLMVVTVARIHHFAPAFLRLAFPAALAFVAMVAARLVEPADAKAPKPAVPQELPRVFWWYIAAAGVLACGFADFPLLSFHFQNARLVAPETIPLLYAGAMAVTGATAMLCGKLFDRHGIIVLVIGTFISLASLPLGFLGGPVAIVVGVCCWAVGIGAQDATLRAGIAQVVSMHKRGSAFGAFNGVFGVMWFLGSVVMGQLYQVSLVALVVFGVGLQLAAAVMFLWVRRPLAAAVEAAR